MKYIGYFFALILIISSCSDRSSKAVDSFVKNESGRDFTINFSQINPYLKSQLLTFKNNETIQVTNYLLEGKDGILDHLAFSYEDSLVIVFSDGKKLTHYNSFINGKNPLAIPFQDNRNYYNVINWEKKILSDTKNKIEVEYNYKITAQDYLRAR
jgi:hypothetical protein